MNCQDICTLINQKHFWEATNAEIGAVVAHCRRCSVCRRFFEQLGPEDLSPEDHRRADEKAERVANDPEARP